MRRAGERLRPVRGPHRARLASGRRMILAGCARRTSGLNPRAGQIAGGGGDHGEKLQGLLETISESTARHPTGDAVSTAFAG